MLELDRLARAHELLSTSLSLTVIALECGFYDLPHLDKAFRSRLGMSPQEFRRLEAGAIAFLPKPVDGDVLLGAVDRALSRP
jgi:transcriptional regulator GlxA family with amidase domain